MAERVVRRWVLTGPTGSGKSLVAGFLRELGALVVDADAVGHRVLEEPAVIAALTAAFGAEMLRDGCLDRAALGRRVFADPAALARLNAVVHPRLAARLRAELDACVAAPDFRGLAVLEAAVYFQLPPLGPVDLVVAVTADAALRRERLIAARQLDPAAVDARIAAQQPLLADFARADVVLHNDGDVDALRAAVRRLHAERCGTPPFPEER